MSLAKMPNGLEVNYLNLDEMRFLYDDIFVDKTHFRHGVTLRDGACVLDVGANIGLFALYVHRHWKNTRILAFEPVPEVFQVLLANVVHHVIDAQLFPCALGAQTGEATFAFYVNRSVMSSGAEAEAAPAGGGPVESVASQVVKAREFTVPVRPLSDVIAEAKLEVIDLLKIDVEKTELDVILGVGDHNWAKIRQIVVDVHDTGGRLGAMRSLFSVLGYKVEVEQDARLAPTNIWTLYGVRP